MSITIYPSQFNMREDGSYAQLPAIKGEEGTQGPPGVGSLPGGTKGQVPVKQSADDYDVAWGYLAWERIWVNASPDSSFAAQTIPKDLSQYGFIAVFFKARSDWPERSGILVIPVFNSASKATWGSNNVVIAAFSSTYSGQAGGETLRRDVRALETGIYFGGGMRQLGSTETSDNNYAVPVYIWGISGTPIDWR